MNQNKSSYTFLHSVLIAVFVLNQMIVGSITNDLGLRPGKIKMLNLFSVKQASAMEIMMPILNEDGMTTHLQMMPTITEVHGEPKGGDIVQNAMAVMIATGTPFYSNGISFDDPVNALSQWGNLANTLEINPEYNDRYEKLIGIFPCNFCCGSAMAVALNGRCGCAHANAARGFFKQMLNEYGNTYSDEQLVGEAYRWQAIWYPSGVVEDYLLGTGRGDVLGHKTHGGAGSDGMHGTQ